MKPYSRIAAISKAFKILKTNVLKAEQRKPLQAIRAHLDSLEDGGSQVISGTLNMIEVWAISAAVEITDLCCGLIPVMHGRIVAIGEMASLSRSSSVTSDR